MSEQCSLRMHQVVLDSTDIRGLAEFYRSLPGLVYRPGEEPPEAGEHDERPFRGYADPVGRPFRIFVA